MANITGIPSQRVPFIDSRTGLMSREWYRYLLNLFELTGAGTTDVSLLDLQVSPPNQEINLDALVAQSALAAMGQQFDDMQSLISTQPVQEIGTVASQNADNVTITGGAVTATIRAKAAGGYKSSDGSAGYTGTLTTASLVGKTVTIKDGIITNIA